MIMTDGSIQNNSALSVAGGLLSDVEVGSLGNAVVYLRGGIISDNNAPTDSNLRASNGGQIIDQR